MNHENKLSLPYKRLDLLATLEFLSNHEYQKDIYLHGKKSQIAYDELDLAIHFLYDDTQLSNNPYFHIGQFLKNECEAKALECLIGSIEKIFEKYGTTLDNREYIVLPEWSNVVSNALHALKLCRPAKAG